MSVSLAKNLKLSPFLNTFCRFRSLKKTAFTDYTVEKIFKEPSFNQCPEGFFLQIDRCQYCKDWLSESVVHSVTLIRLSVLCCHLANVQASFIFRRLSVNVFRNRHWQWPQQSYHIPLGSHLKYILSLVGWKISSYFSIKKSTKFKTFKEMQKKQKNFRDSLSSI